MIRTRSIYKLMKRRSHLRKEHDERTFDSSAIGDLAFLLLIFFIVTSSFILRQGLKLSLPSKSAGAVRVAAERIVEVYPQNEGYVVNERPVSREDLKAMLLVHKKKHEKPIVLIHMGNEVKYKRLIDTLSLIKKEVGIRTVSVKNGSTGEANG